MQTRKTPNSETGVAQAPEAVIKVCIVEDDAWLRKDLALQLSQAPGFECLGSWGTAEKALEMIPRLKPDVVLMDINLPGVNGIECVRRLTAELPELAVLMLTVYEEGDLIFESLQAGAKGYLLKRSQPEELLKAIAELQQGGSPMTPSVARRVVQFFSARRKPDLAVEQLSDRETQVLHLLAKGCAYKEIANQLTLSTHTIRMFIRHIYRKLQVHSRAEATAMLPPSPLPRPVPDAFSEPPQVTPISANLTVQEKKVLEGLTRGLPYKLIADEIGVSVNTVRTHLRHIYEKLQVHSRTEAVAHYLKSSG